MLPSASAYTVLFDEFVCSSSTSRKDAKSFAFVRSHDCMSAFTGSSMSRTLTQRPSAARTMGP